MESTISLQRYRRRLTGLFLATVSMLFFNYNSAFAAEFVSIEIFPEHVGVFTVDGEQQFVAFGYDTQGKETNITTKVEWESSDPSLVTINEDGLAEIIAGVTAGGVKITASYPKSGKSLAGVLLLLNRTPVTLTFTVGGTVSGLATGNEVVLQNNAGDNLTVDANGTFTFATPMDDGESYAVTVLTNPTVPNQTCSVVNGSSTLSGANVTNVEVTCTTDQYTIGGNVTGLTSGTLTLQNNGGDNLAITEDGAFEFSTPIDDGAAYEVTVSEQPVGGLVCTPSSNLGNVSGQNVTDVAVACSE